MKAKILHIVLLVILMIPVMPVHATEVQEELSLVVEEQVIEEIVDETAEGITDNTVEEITEETMEESEEVITEETIQETVEESVVDTIVESDEIVAATDGVVINATNFPDANFREYIKEDVDEDGNGVLSVNEISECTHLFLSDKNIGSLKGIEYFVGLTYLSCSNNVLYNLDVSKNVNLETLWCTDNYLSQLNVSKNVNLEALNCYDNKLSQLDVSRNVNLKELDCNGNNLSQLNVSKNVNLETLSCYNNSLSQLDVRMNTNLERLDCSDNVLSSLDVSNSVSLESLNCNDNSLSSLDVSRNVNLESLYCSNNVLDSLDVSKNINLEMLWCYHNKLNRLNIGNCVALESLDCGYNNLTALDVNDCLYIKTIECSDNELNQLDVSKNIYLESLWCSYNNLCYLDISNCTKLNYFSCSGNKLIALDLSKQSKIKNKEIYTYIDSGTTEFDFSDFDYFEINKVIEVDNLVLDGRVFKFENTNWQSGSYKYNCSNGNVLSVRLRYVEGAEPFIPNGENPWKFVDVVKNPGYWKYEAVKYVHENGIMNGVGDGTRFDPDAPLTREMFATVLYRMAGQPAVTYTNKFPDVPGGKWYSNAVIWASEQGIVSGYGSGNFGTGHYITREQIAKMFMEYGKVQGYDVSRSADFSTFADAGNVSDWANDYVEWAVGSGMIGGSLKDGKYYLNPQGNATRAESATMLKRFDEKY